MNLKHFGDSYDILKKSLLQWLSPFGPWAVQPMFTHSVSKDEAGAFSRFLGVELASTEILLQSSDRQAYLAVCRGYRSIFVDPDTGVRLRSGKDKGSVRFIFGDELIAMAADRKEGLVLTFDQSLARGREREGVQAKLDYFLARGVHGFAYISHASFLALGESRVVRQAREQLLASSGLPKSRIVMATPHK